MFCLDRTPNESRSVVSDSATPWPVARQAPLSVGFSRQEYWSGVPCPPPGDLPNLGIKPASLTSLLHWQPGSLPLASPGKPKRTPNADVKEVGPEQPGSLKSNELNTI